MSAHALASVSLLMSTSIGVTGLRELILEMAMQGRLVSQQPNDEPASELLKRIAAEKARLVGEGAIKQAKADTIKEKRPYELPKGWEWSSLAESTLINPRNAADDAMVVSFVPMALIGSNFDGVHSQESRRWGEVKQGFTHFAEGDIGVAKITPCFENGKACIFSNLANGLGAGTTELHIVRPVSKSLDARYVLAYVKSPQFLRVGRTKMTGTAGQKRLPKKFVEANPFPVPPLEEQHRIVAKLDELMALCDLLDAKQNSSGSAHAQLVEALLWGLLQASDSNEFATSCQRLFTHFHSLFKTESSIVALKRAVQQLAIMGKLVRQVSSDEPASVLLKTIGEEKSRLVAEGKIRKQPCLAEITAEEIPFDLPAGWAWARLGSQVLDSGAGWSPSCESRPREGDQWAVLKVSAVSWGNYRPGENKSLPPNLDPRPEHEVVAGDFLVSRANTSELVARSVLVEKTPKHLMLSDKIIRLRLTAKCDRRYINLANSAPLARDYYARVAGGTSSSMQNVSREQILGLIIPVPPLSEQARIMQVVDNIFAQCDAISRHIADSKIVEANMEFALVAAAAQGITCA